jgi:hypothetical protein
MITNRAKGFTPVEHELEKWRASPAGRGGGTVWLAIGVHSPRWTVGRGLELIWCGHAPIVRPSHCDNKYFALKSDAATCDRPCTSAAVRSDTFRRRPTNQTATLKGQGA